MKLYEQIKVEKSRSGKAKGRWFGKVFAGNGDELIHTTQPFGYANRKECEHALIASALLTLEFFNLLNAKRIKEFRYK